MNEKLQKQMGSVFENARRVNKILSEQYNIGDDVFVPLQSVFDAVKQETGYEEITIYEQPFSSFLKNSDIRNKAEVGAMLSTRTYDGSKIAEIVLNSDKDSRMQRFSAVHELGHLINELPNFIYETSDDGVSTLSAHINPDITWLDEEDVSDLDYLICEQMANIFALLVLIRRDIRIQDVTNGGSRELAAKYGVTEAAVFSRVILSAMRKT